MKMTEISSSSPSLPNLGEMRSRDSPMKPSRGDETQRREPEKKKRKKQ